MAGVYGAVCPVGERMNALGKIPALDRSAFEVARQAMIAAFCALHPMEQRQEADATASVLRQLAELAK